MKILCCGGSLDGEWREVGTGVREFRALKPQKFNWGQDDKVETEIEYEEYRIVPINILGFGMHVAMLWGMPDEGKAVLRALVQRDVFEQLTNGRRVRHV